MTSLIRNGGYLALEFHGAPLHCRENETDALLKYFFCFIFRTKVCSQPILLPFGMYEDNWVGQRALEMLEARPADKPWFMQVPARAAPLLRDRLDGGAIDNQW